MPGARTALIVIDMLNTYEHEDGDRLKVSARRAVPVIAMLLAKARDQDARIVYINDSHGDWTVGRTALVERTRKAAGPDLVDEIAPSDDVPFLLKARHSIFYETPIEFLLHQYDIRRIVLTGQVTEQCILYSALDAYIRGFGVTIVPGAVAHIDRRLADAAIAMMKRNMRAQVVDQDQCDFAAPTPPAN
jgi:nicotinamidase-related amidase